MIERSDIEQIIPEILLIDDADLRDKVALMWLELAAEGGWSDLAMVPVSAHMPGPQIAHTRAVARLSMAVADIAEDVHGTRLDRDLLLASAIVQDACKLVEYEVGEDGAVARTPIGRLMGHGTYGAVVAHRVGLPIDVINVILSHSPGSTIEMATVEAKILADIDQIDVAILGGDRFIRKVIRYR